MTSNVAKMCPSCAQKNQAMTNLLATLPPAESQDCLYTIEQLINKLYALEISPLENNQKLSFLRSAIEFHQKDCNRFNALINDLF